MNNPASIKYTPKLVLTAVLSGGLTIGVSLVYILICLACIVFRFNCNYERTTNTANFIWDTIYFNYIQSSSCQENSTKSEEIMDDLTKSVEIMGDLTKSVEIMDDLTKPEEIMDDLTVVILAGVTLGISVLCLAAAITLVSIVQDQSKSRFIGWTVYVYIGCCIASLIVDLTTAVLFGIDYTNISEVMSSMSDIAKINEFEIIRQGAFWMMTIALKGYIPHIISCVLLVLLVVHLLEFQNAIKNDEHSIHKLGVLNAFDSSRKPEETWSQSDILYNNTQFLRGPQMNNGFIEDDSSQRSPRRPDPPRSDYFSTNRSFDRSDSWHHTQNSDPQGSRLFSYLDDIKRPALTKPPASPAVESDSPWRRDPWQSQTPPVPAPDYSPNQPRRLKSALKSPYM